MYFSEELGSVAGLPHLHWLHWFENTPARPIRVKSGAEVKGASSARVEGRPSVFVSFHFVETQLLIISTQVECLILDVCFHVAADVQSLARWIAASVVFVPGRIVVFVRTARWFGGQGAANRPSPRPGLEDIRAAVDALDFSPIPFEVQFDDADMVEFDGEANRGCPSAAERAWVSRAERPLV